MITLMMDRVPNLNSGNERYTFLLSLQHLNCLQLKIIHTHKELIVERPILNPFTEQYIFSLKKCNNLSFGF